MKEKILVIDDEAAIQRFLDVSLTAEGYNVLEAHNAEDGIRQAASSRPDLIILDLGLPDMDGYAVLKRIREWSTVPIIVLTVKDAESDKVKLLDAGANDYMTKPFSVPELLARLRVLLRQGLPQSQDSIFQNGHLEIDFAARIVKSKGQIVKLTGTEYDLLRMLAKNAGKLLTQRQLLKEIWGPGSVEHSHYLRVYVGQLRRKLEKDPSRPELITTEPGVGYRMNLLDS